MNKELTPLQALERLRPTTTYQPYYSRNERRYCCDIIETALKRLEVYETFGLLDEKYDDVDKLTDIKGKLTYVDRVMDTQERLLASVSSDEIRILNSVLNSQIRNLKKKLKALEIIKKRKVNVRCLMSGWNLGKYNSYKSHIKLTEEEYDLLREVLL